MLNLPRRGTAVSEILEVQPYEFFYNVDTTHFSIFTTLCIVHFTN